jgi:hypothetical protein
MHNVSRGTFMVRTITDSDHAKKTTKVGRGFLNQKHPRRFLELKHGRRFLEVKRDGGFLEPHRRFLDVCAHSEDF